ncbi:MAG: sterol desaturase family protein [Bacteroidota bacterium]
MEEIVLKMENHIGLVLFGLFIFSLALAVVEFFYELYKKKITKWRLGEMWASFSVFLVAQLTEKIGTVVFAGSFIFIAQFIPWQIPVNIWTTLLCILVVDFLYYWEHVVEHRVRFFWAYHSIHHSSPIYNYTTALRVSFIDNFFGWIFYVPAVLVGFNPYIIVLTFFLILTYQFWLHTEIIGKLGWFEKIFMTPSQHRVHHGANNIYLDKNYGALFCIWDRMFGTFQEEKQTPRYGLTQQINTINPVKIHAHEYINICKDLKRARTWKEAWNYLIKGPDWSPEHAVNKNPTRKE